MRIIAVVVCVSAIGIAGCSPHGNLQPVMLPSLAGVDAGVQTQVRERYDRLKRAMDGRSTPVPELATAYGEYGMVLQAAEFLDAAEPCLLNAGTLSVGDVRWPYYLATLYKSRGETVKAEAAFTRALELQPNDLATLIWLARLNLDQGKTSAAESLFRKADAIAPGTVVVLAGLGRVAVDKRDYAAAAEYLERALMIDPDAESLHAPLAAAYRGLGQIERARPHIGQWRNRDLPVPDPRQEQVDALLESGLSYELRGVRAFERHDWKAAAGYFSRGLALTKSNSPLRRSLQHKLGTALYLTGDAPGAAGQFQAVADAGPAEGIDEATAKSHYSLGVLAYQNGQRSQAVAHLSAAVKYQPNYVEAHLAFADALRWAGNPGRALLEYREAAQINPRSVPARLGYAMTMVTLGRASGARDWLVEASKLYPDRLEYQHALARLLAASSTESVRDARRALAIIDQYFPQQKTTDVGETIAMALADLGDYTLAVGIQRGVIAAATRAGMTGAVRRMTENLDRYEHQQPCRTPWPNDRPVALSDSPIHP